MATIGNFKEDYIKYDSSSEEQPTVMPITGGAIPEGMFLYDTATATLYSWVGGAWLEQ